MKSLEKILTPASLRGLARKYPPERLRWALERFTNARNTRKIENYASYFLRIVYDDDQYERYMCDQLALGNEKAQKRQKDLDLKRHARKEETRKRKLEEEDAAFRAYLDTVPVGVAKELTEYALQRWADREGADLEKMRRKGHLLKRCITALYETHVRTEWLEHGRPEQYAPEHLQLPEEQGNANESG